MRTADLARAAQVRADLKSGKARESRIGCGVSAADVARVIGVSEQAVFYWETGRNAPTVPHALAYGRLLAALGKRAALPSGHVLLTCCLAGGMAGSGDPRAWPSPPFR